ncbi:MAG: cobalamin-dependent protein [Oligoflexia bacterium]|nr:cobalamin-dependent protein [Oligoflexia bacterium]
MESSFHTLLISSPCERLRFNLSGIYPVPRIGLGILSNFLKQNGFTNTHIIDLVAEKMSIKDFIFYLKNTMQPQIIGISTTILSMRETFTLARTIKKHFPHIFIVVGGPGISFRKETLFKYATSGIDFFIRGEGEFALLKLVQELNQNTFNFASIPNLIWKDKNNETINIIENETAPFRDLNDGIEVDYQALPMKKYGIHPPMGAFPPATMVETARGCSFDCAFCCLTNKKVRFKNPHLVEKEIIYLQKNFSIKEIHFIDPTFTLNYERCQELCQRLIKLKIHWSCKTRVDCVDSKLLYMMSQSGCYHIAFGVESGDNSVLESLNKGHHNDKAIEAFKWCRYHKIRSSAYLTIGNPHENDYIVNHNIKFIKKLNPDYILYSILWPDPKSIMTQNGILNKQFTHADVEQFYLGNHPGSNANISCYFDNYSLAGIPTVQIEKWLKQLSKSFYLRPSYFLSRLIDIRSYHDILNLIIGGKYFLKDLYIQQTSPM